MWVVDTERVDKIRSFFKKYANSNGFDPHVPQNWYSQSKKKIMAVEVYHFLKITI